MNAYEHYEYNPHEPFKFPIYTFAGSGDHTQTADMMKEWQQHTTEKLIGPTMLLLQLIHLTKCRLPGNHFYLRQDGLAKSVVQDITEALNLLLKTSQ